jgi:hypothetical protein
VKHLFVASLKSASLKTLQRDSCSAVANESSWNDSIDKGCSTSYRRNKPLEVQWARSSLSGSVMRWWSLLLKPDISSVNALESGSQTSARREELALRGMIYLKRLKSTK